MLKKEYELFLKLKEKLDKKLDSAMSEMNIWSGCVPVDYDYDEIRVEGHETWSYGGSEFHSGTISLSKILDSRQDFIDEVLKDLHATGIEYIDSMDTAARHKLYQKLKEQFESTPMKNTNEPVLFDRWTENDDEELKGYLKRSKGRISETIEEIHELLKKTPLEPDTTNNSCIYAGIWLSDMSIMYVVDDPENDPYDKEGYFEMEMS